MTVLPGTCKQHTGVTCREAGTPVAQFQLGQWEGHVLAMQPFYQLLFPMMLTMLRSRLTAKAASTLRDTAKVCNQPWLPETAVASQGSFNCPGKGVAGLTRMSC